MSADSPRRAIRCIPAVVPPQPVNDRSIIDSVTGFINDVTLTNVPPHESKDSVLWVRFETLADCSDLTFGNDWDCEGDVSPPLLLILGYGNGIQIYALPANGEAIEVLSWRHGNVKVLRVLPTPNTIPLNNDLVDVDSQLQSPIYDQYADKRTLIALCDCNSNGMVNGSQYCSVNFISLKTGEQVKSIKFKNPIVDILANRSSVVITFSERIAVFDARTFEDRLTVTTCHPCTYGLNPNPVALGTRWMAYAERKLMPSKRSSGGCECDGVSSYTATVLNAAKSLGKGLRELGEHVAAGFTGSVHQSSVYSNSMSGNHGYGTNNSNGNEDKQPGIITIIDVKYPIKDVSPTTGAPVTQNGYDPIVAHFIAHTDTIVAIYFDHSGQLLLTADRRGHDFHIFRIQPHPGSSASSAVHHLYVLHRGDTAAKVQDVSFSLDSRWVAVSTVRGTTHVFPITPYGGPVGVRTHGSSRVVNRLSRFRRSAGLSIDGRSSSPVLPHSAGHVGYSPMLSNSNDTAQYNQMSNAYYNPRASPFPHPTVVNPLAQLRQPININTISPSGSSGSISSSPLSSSSASNASMSSPMSTSPGGGAGIGMCTGQSSTNQILLKNNRQRLTSLSSDDTTKPLRVSSTFGRSRAWLLESQGVLRENPSNRMQRKTIDSLFIMTGHGVLIQYDLEPKHATSVPKEKVCDDTPIELEVEAKAQWNLLRKESSNEIQPPLPLENWLLKDRLWDYNRSDGLTTFDTIDERADDRWLSQVEITTHAGPHRRLWMGPQFVFKTYNTPSGSPLSHIDTEAIEIDSNTQSGNRPARSNPMNMPLYNTPIANIIGGVGNSDNNSSRSIVPVLIESGSCSSYEQSPRLLDRVFEPSPIDTDFSLAPGDSQLREDLADAMRESPGCGYICTDTTGLKNNAAVGSSDFSSSSLQTDQNVYDMSSDLQYNYKFHNMIDASNPAANENASILHHLSNDQSNCSTASAATIEKFVNPLGIVTTIKTLPSDADKFMMMMDQQQYGLTMNDDDDDECILENCDESLFRPVITVLSETYDNYDFDKRTSTSSDVDDIGCGGRSGINDSRRTIEGHSYSSLDEKYRKRPEPIGRELIVPVIEKTTTSGRRSVPANVSSTTTTTITDKVSNIDEDEKLSLKIVDIIDNDEIGCVAADSTSANVTPLDITPNGIIQKPSKSSERKNLNNLSKSQLARKQRKTNNKKNVIEILDSKNECNVSTNNPITINDTKLKNERSDSVHLENESSFKFQKTKNYNIVADNGGDVVDDVEDVDRTIVKNSSSKDEVLNKKKELLKVDNQKETVAKGILISDTKPSTSQITTSFFDVTGKHNTTTTTITDKVSNIDEDEKLSLKIVDIIDNDEIGCVAADSTSANVTPLDITPNGIIQKPSKSSQRKNLNNLSKRELARKQRKTNNKKNVIEILDSKNECNVSTNNPITINDTKLKNERSDSVHDLTFNGVTSKLPILNADHSEYVDISEGLNFHEDTFTNDENVCNSYKRNTNDKQLDKSKTISLALEDDDAYLNFIENIFGNDESDTYKICDKVDEFADVCVHDVDCNDNNLKKSCLTFDEEDGVFNLYDIKDNISDIKDSLNSSSETINSEFKDKLCLNTNSKIAKVSSSQKPSTKQSRSKKKNDFLKLKSQQRNDIFSVQDSIRGLYYTGNDFMNPIFKTDIGSKDPIVSLKKSSSSSSKLNLLKSPLTANNATEKQLNVNVLTIDGEKLCPQKSNKEKLISSPTMKVATNKSNNLENVLYDDIDDNKKNVTPNDDRFKCDSKSDYYEDFMGNMYLKQLFEGEFEAALGSPNMQKTIGSSQKTSKTKKIKSLDHHIKDGSYQWNQRPVACPDQITERCFSPVNFDMESELQTNDIDFSELSSSTQAVATKTTPWPSSSSSSSSSSSLQRGSQKLVKSLPTTVAFCDTDTFYGNQFENYEKLMHSLENSSSDDECEPLIVRSIEHCAGSSTILTNDIVNENESSFKFQKTKNYNIVADNGGDVVDDVEDVDRTIVKNSSSKDEVLNKEKELLKVDNQKETVAKGILISDTKPSTSQITTSFFDVTGKVNTIQPLLPPSGMDMTEWDTPESGSHIPTVKRVKGYRGRAKR